MSAIDADRTQIRNSSEIYDHYTKYGDVIKSRRCLITALSEHFADDLIVFTGKGFASLLVFREKASEIRSYIMLHLTMMTAMDWTVAKLVN